MRDVEIPNWLKGLPLAPEFHPTDTEFADPIAYISKIEKEASAFGICKVIPPFPKPTKKYVVSNLNNSLSKCPELGSDVNLSSTSSSSKTDNGDKVNGGEVRAVFTTRHQELGQGGKKTKGAIHPQPPPVHKQVWQSGEIYTLEQFESKSKTFARTHLGMVKEVSPLVIETLFWQAALEKPIYVEYANDVPGSGFAEPEGPFRNFHRRRRRRKTFCRNSPVISSSHKDQSDTLSNDDEKKGASASSIPSSSEMSKENPTSPNMLSDQTSRPSRQKSSNAGNEMERTSGWKLSNSPWNLQVIARAPGSLTRFMPDDIPGVTSPMVYIGMLFSWFAWHVEDHELHSLNFLHTGSQKTWYAVPGDYAFTFEETIRKQAYGGNIDRFAALTLLGEKTTLLSPEVIVSSGIPCCRLVQNPGEFVVTFPRAYHVGFSHGFNCGEAANFGTPKWLTVAKEAAVRRAAMNYLPMLSHQQLLYLLTMSFISRVPRALLPGVRSSRLRDRQKEEREMLVKKAFIEDILKENNLLSILLRKKSSYHGVLWDLESLQASIKESDLCSSIARVHTTPKENNYSEKDNNQDLYREMRLYMENVNNLYADDDNDLSFTFQVDTGTLPCVACGVLGFPFMSIVQPSEKASKDLLLPAEQHHTVLDIGFVNPVLSHPPPELHGMVEGSISDGARDQDKKSGIVLKFTNCGKSHVDASSISLQASDRTIPTESNLFQHPNGASYSEVKLDKGWNTSNGYLRPRIFCLEHAIQIEELLQSKGGANMLLICHSDFQKVKAHAAAVAEEIGSVFHYKEIPLDEASKDDLNLINLAIDSEEKDECNEDWTSKLNVNMRHCVKLRKVFPTEKEQQHALTLRGLFSDTAPSSSALSLTWKSKKFRSKRNISHPHDSKPCESILHKKKEVLEVKPDAHLRRKEDKIIQYTRRIFKSKRPASAGASKGPGDPRKLLPEESSAVYCADSNGKSRNTTETCTGKCEMQHEHEGLVKTGDLTESSVQSQIVDPIIAVNSIKAQMGSQTLEETFMKDDKVCDSTQDDLQLQHEVEVADDIREKTDVCYTEISGGSPSVTDQVTENIEIESENQIAEEISLPGETCDLAVTVADFEGRSSVHANGDVLMEEVSDHANSTGPVADETAVASIYEHLEKTSENANESKNDNEHISGDDRTLINEATSVSAEGLDVERESDVAEEMQSGGENCSLPEKKNPHSNNPGVERRSNATDRGKRKREVELQTEYQSGVDGFIKSPCEGLRPRATKETTTRSGIDENKKVEDKPAMKKSRNFSNGLVPQKDKKENRKGSTHGCDLEGCRLKFKTKAELALHKRNRCPHEGCGKKFRSHKYAVLHLRVHDDDRPLKCPWKGCKMSFKWAWARTEHLRVHTGERPYQCKVDGCGLTFRFVSDYSRHRRKTGHYVNIPH